MFRDLWNIVVDSVRDLVSNVINIDVKVKDPKTSEKIQTCPYVLGTEVRVNDRVQGVAKRYWKKRGVIESVYKTGDDYNLGLKILDRKSLLWVLEDDVNLGLK